jgi:hypothetical protein
MKGRTVITAHPARHSESWQAYSRYKYRTNLTMPQQPINMHYSKLKSNHETDKGILLKTEIQMWEGDGHRLTVS